jgi:hypothetical protein
VKNEERNSSENLFVIGTSNKYRTYSLISVAKELQKQNKNPTILCSPSAKSRQKEWEKSNLDTITHTELHGYVSITSLIRFLPSAVLITNYIQKTIPHKTSGYDIIIAYNYVITEYVKRESVKPLMRENPCVHTHSPMPYIIENTIQNRIFVYQHGIQWKSANNLMAVPFYVPLTYFIWSDVWKESFNDAAHSESQIIPVGSPWHDHLANSNTKREPNFDVLLVSQPPYTSPDEKERNKEFVRTVVDFCQKEELSLKIKLHPNESANWYKEQKLESYIDEFEDIDDALEQTRIAVTDNSSAFVESSVYGIPIVVADILNIGLASLAPVQNVLFPKDVDDLPAAMTDALSGELPQTDRKVVETGSAIEQILLTVNKRKYALG